MGHAVETMSSYGALRHGEAVAIGMEVVAALSRAVAGLDETDAVRQTALLRRLGLPTRIEGLAADAIIRQLAQDKKTLGGRPRFVLARQIGAAEPGVEVADEALREALLECGAGP